MRTQAGFDVYLDQVKVTEADLSARGLNKQPDFYAWVPTASDSDQLVGMAVSYGIAWTFDLRPTSVLKDSTSTP